MNKEEIEHTAKVIYSPIHQRGHLVQTAAWSDIAFWMVTYVFLTQLLDNVDVSRSVRHEFSVMCGCVQKAAC